MLTPATKTFDGVQVTFIPLPLLSASSVDARVAALVLPLLELLETTDLSKMDINLKALGTIMSRSLAGLSSQAQTDLIVDSLRGCTVVVPGKAPAEITDAATLNKTLEGVGLDVLYQIVFEAWRFNKLSPFVLAARIGLKTLPIPSFTEPKAEADKPGLKLARSGTSAQT